LTITYSIGNSLYINLTNRCSNSCDFCIRNYGDSVGGAGSLWLEREPSREEALEDIQKRDLTKFSEIVFCGYGEPTERLDDMLWICSKLKEAKAPLIRLNTNGHASLIAGADTAARFKGLVDTISISLNAASSAEYYNLCKPLFGTDTYEAILDFAKRVRAYVPNVVLSIVGGTTDEDACQKIAEYIGLPLRVR